MYVRRNVKPADIALTSEFCPPHLRPAGAPFAYRRHRRPNPDTNRPLENVLALVSPSIKPMITWLVSANALEYRGNESKREALATSTCPTRQLTKVTIN